MSDEELCEQLRHSGSLADREAILQANFTSTNALAVVLDRARSVMSRSPEEALVLAEVTVEVAHARKELSMAASAGRVQGQAYRLLGRHNEAIDAFQKAADAAQQAGDLRLVAQVQIGSVDSLGMIGRYEDAITLAKSLEKALQEVGAVEDAARVLVNVGSIHFRRDQYARALECYEQAGEILESGDDPTVIARIWSNCANALTHLNRLDDAIALYERARICFVKSGLTIETAFVDTNLGYLHSVSGKHALAVASLIQARREFLEHGREPEAARCAIDLGEAYRALNLFPEAMECYSQGIVVLKRIGVEYDQARAELGIAASLMALGRLDESVESLARANHIFRNQKNALQVAHVRLLQAYLLRAGGQQEDARREAEFAAKTFTRNRLSGLAAEARFLLADMALDQGTGAARAMHSVVRVAKRTARGWLECRAEHALGLYYVRLGRIDQSLRHFRAGAKALLATHTLIAPEEMYVAFLRDKMTLYEDLVETLLTRGRPRDVEEALEYVEQSKSRRLLERMQAALEGHLKSPEVAEATLEKIATLRSALSRGYYQLHTLGDANARRLTQESQEERDALIPLERAYAEELQNVERSQMTAARAFLDQTTAVAASDLRAALQPNETLVEFYVVREHICAFVISPSGVQILQSVASLKDVQFSARRLRYHLKRLQMPSEYAILLQDQLLTGIKNILSDLYNLLIRPLQDFLTEKIVIVPHGILHGLPFHAFYDGQKYALDRWEFLYAPSAAVWHLGVRKHKHNTKCSLVREERRIALIMGVPGAGMERIDEEVAVVARCFTDAMVFCGETATLEAFQSWGERCEILHLAAHALFRNDNPLFSGLQFRDGWLLARDLYGMNLDCDLATLSACETGVTVVEAGDELFGLIRGFLGAGVRSVAASLWSADDASTAYLMACFYTDLSQGKSPASALQRAQQQAREIYPHPYYWAAFTLVGQRERNTKLRKKRGKTDA